MGVSLRPIDEDLQTIRSGGAGGGNSTDADLQAIRAGSTNASGPMDADLAAIRGVKPATDTSWIATENALHPVAPEQPGLLSRAGHAIAATAEDLYHNPSKIITGPIDSFIQGTSTPVVGGHVSLPAANIARRHHIQGTPEPLVAGTEITQENTPNAITQRQQDAGLLNTVANVGAGLAGGVIGAPLKKVVGDVAGEIGGRMLGNAAAGAVTNPTDPIVGAASNAVTGEALHHGIGAVAPQLAKMGGGDTPISHEIPVAEDVPQTEYRNAGPSLNPAQIGKVVTGYRRAMVTPYAPIEDAHPELVDALHTAGAAQSAAKHLGSRATDWVTDGLSPEQQTQFGQQLVLDNMRAEAARKATTDPQASQQFLTHAQNLSKQMGSEVSGDQWFKDAVERHNQYVAPSLTPAAIGAGVDPASFRNPQSAYVKLISEDRLTNKEIRRAMDANQVATPGELSPRGPIGKFLIGEKPGLERLQSPGTGGLRQGPLNPSVPSTGTDMPNLRRGASQSGSAQGAQGTAREYVTDYKRIIGQDALDKLPRAADNAVYSELSKVGRALQPNEEPALGKRAVQRNVLDLNGNPTVQRFEVDPDVAKALRTYEARKTPTDNSGWRKFTSAATRLQIAGMPVEATSHMNTLASVVGSVPGEKDMAGKIIAAVPGIGGKLAATREMTTIDFNDPTTRALETRLAQAGALRFDDRGNGPAAGRSIIRQTATGNFAGARSTIEDRGGAVNLSHHALFGPQGVDTRGRLVLARKYLVRNPNASDADLREFINGSLGNYNRANSGAAVNALQDAGISSFARFQAARIPTSIRRTAGISDLPATKTGTAGFMQRAGDVANTLYRGPLGYVAGAEVANRLLNHGQSTNDNEKGHQYDVKLPFTIGAHERPAYIPSTFLNPVVATGLRATGLRDLISRPGAPNIGGRFAGALRDVVNTGLGVLSPAVRGLSVAATGRTPYVESDGSMLRLSNNRFNQGSQAKGRIMTALGAANPAISAFAEQGGDVGGNSLSDALAQDGKRFGGPKSTAAAVASFLLPRVASVGVGGRDNERSAWAQNDRDYTGAMQDYKSQLRRAPGPIAQDQIIEAAIEDAKSDGRFNPKVVEQELQRYVSGQGKRDQRNDRRLLNFQRSHEH